VRIKYFDERLCEDKIERGLTKGEYNSRMGDLRMMELGGHVSSVQGSVEKKKRVRITNDKPRP